MKKAIASDTLFRHDIEETKPSNHAMTGILGALLGAIAGGALWVGLGQSRSLSHMNFIAGGAVSLLVFMGYQWLGGKRSLFSMVFCFILSSAVIGLAEVIDWGAFLYRTYHHDYDIAFWDAFQAVPDILKDNPESLKAFAWDLLLGLLFSAAGGISFLLIMGEKSREQKGDNKE